jgi:hypothetical protein
MKNTHRGQSAVATARRARKAQIITWNEGKRFGGGSSWDELRGESGDEHAKNTIRGERAGDRFHLQLSLLEAHKSFPRYINIKNFTGAQQSSLPTQGEML